VGAACRSGLTAGGTVVVSLAVVVGGNALIEQPVAEQSMEIADIASGGIERVQAWLAGPPLELSSERIDEAAAT